MLEASVLRAPGKTALCGPGGTLSFEELLAQTLALGRFLAGAGLGRGARVGILARKSPESIVAFLGTAAAGGVAFTVDYNLSPENLTRIFSLTRPEILIVEDRYVGDARAALGVDTQTRLLVIGSRTPRQDWLWEEALRETACPTALPQLCADEVVYLNLTSGTSGQPKAVATTHANLFWNTCGAVQALHLSPEDVHLCLFPIFGHPHEIFLRALYLGGTAVLLDSLLPSAIAAAAQLHRVTTMMAATTIYQTILRAPNLDPAALSTVRIAECGGMHLSPGVFAQFLETFGVRIVPVWGSTETAGIAFAADPCEAYVPGSVGRPSPHYEAILVDEFGGNCEPGEVGELWLSGPGVCSAYTLEGAETRSLTREGWFCSGDFFRRDAQGRFFFAGRRTGMLKVAGMRVYPTEVEDVLAAHPAVCEVAVCATEHASRGEVPMAVIVLKEGCEADPQALRAHCESLLPPYKVPKVFEFRPALPKSAGGKILYSKLKSV